MNDVVVRLENVSKKFDDKYIIKNLTLDIYDGEFITLLGPSGCGKTTILRMISGLENVTEGKIFIDGKDVTDIQPSDREVNTIFQNFALFPHMTVYDNINFGLKMKKVDKATADKRIKDAIKLVKLEGFEDRYPPQLSGGQQQRVAIARGIVMNHKVLLLDESLCSLDLKLKRNMEIELKKLQKKLKMTFIYVTHDQDEALTMSDRIAIINKGVIEQIDTPKEIYRNPKTAFVADFIGESNIFNTTVTKIDNNKAFVELIEGVSLPIDNNNYNVGDKLKIIIRPENITLHKEKVNNSIAGIVSDYTYDGSITKLEIDIGSIKFITIKATTTDTEAYQEGDTVYITVSRENIIIVGDKNEK